MPTGASLTGGPAMRKKLAVIQQKYPNAIAAALFIESQLMATEAKKRTPVDRGTLRGTIHVVGPKREGKKIYTLIAAGGPSAPYAVYVHEDTSAHHETGRSKFIESVIDESKSTLGGRLADRANLASDLDRTLQSSVDATVTPEEE